MCRYGHYEVFRPRRATRGDALTSITLMTLRASHWLNDRSLAGKIIAVTMGVSSAALLLACAALLVYDGANARHSLDRDVGLLADVVATNSTAAVAFGDQSGGEATLRAVAVNRNVRLAAILLEEGALFARFDRGADTSGLDVRRRIPRHLW